MFSFFFDVKQLQEKIEGFFFVGMYSFQDEANAYLKAIFLSRVVEM